MPRSLAPICALLLMAASAFAGVNHWTSTGPEGGSVGSLAVHPIDPNRLFAGGLGGVYRSTDAGETWTRMNLPGLCDSPHPDVVIAPDAPFTVYAPTACGFYRSDDGGDSWTRSPGVDADQVASIAIDPVTPNVLWGASGNAVLASFGGPFVSTDRGEHWTSAKPAHFADTFVFINSVAIVPTTPRRILAIADVGLLTSRDAGVTWTTSSPFGDEQPRQLVVDPNDPMRVHAAGFTGLFTSTDGGVSWDRATVSASRILALPTVPTTLFGLYGTQILRSLDAGRTWEDRFPTMPPELWYPELRAIAVSPAAPDTLYVGPLSGGVLRGHFDDAQFSAANRGLVHSQISSLAADPSAAGTVYAGEPFRAARRTTDAGRSWTAMATYGHVWAIAPTDPPTIYAGGPGWVSRSTDTGRTWTAPSIVGEAPNTLVDLAVDPTSPDILYAAVNASGIHRSTTGGAEWNLMSDGIVRIENGYIGAHWLAVDPQTPSTVYVVANNYLYRSTDSAARWTRWSPPDAWAVSTFTLDHQHPARLYATGYTDPLYALFTSDDGGVSWKTTELTVGSHVQQLLVDPMRPDHLWAYSREQVFLSRDRGQHWTVLARGLPTSAIDAFALDLVAPGVAYAGLAGRGVVTYEDRCGNGAADAFETCDDGNGFGGDGCRADCTIERGGDGIVDVDEECDDGNLVDGDGCDANQTTTRCGNGIVTGNEQCDDGNDVAGDNCEGCQVRCAEDAHCDDANVCTVDRCTIAFCAHDPPTDVATLAQCADDLILGRSPCLGVAVPATFVARVERVSSRLQSLVAGSDRARALQSLRHLARRARRLSPRVGRACARLLRGHVLQTKRMLAAAWPR